VKGLPAVAAAAAGMQVGAAIVASRFALDQTGPASLALWRYLIGLGCLLPALLLLRPEPRLAWRDVAPIAILGIMQFGMLIALLNYGLRTVPSARAALIFATLPLQTMLLGAVLGREKLTRAKTIGVLLTLAGVALAVGERATAAAAGSAAWLGELAVFASATLGALCSLLYQPYLRRYPTLSVSALAMFAAVAFLALAALPEGFFADLPPRFTPVGWAAVAFIGVGSGAGYYLWLWALRHASPTRVTIFLSLSPLTAAGLGAWLLGETLSALTVLGLISVVLGLWVAHWQAHPPPAAQTTPQGDPR